MSGHRQSWGTEGTLVVDVISPVVPCSPSAARGSSLKPSAWAAACKCSSVLLLAADPGFCQHGVNWPARCCTEMLSAFGTRVTAVPESHLGTGMSSGTSQPLGTWPQLCKMSSILGYIHYPPVISTSTFTRSIASQSTSPFAFNPALAIKLRISSACLI